MPYGPDDGTIAPWAVITSLPFAPDIVLPAIDYYINQVKLTEFNPYGFKATFNPTYPEKSSNPYGWISPWHYGLNQGPIVLMIENYRSGLLWNDLSGGPIEILSIFTGMKPCYSLQVGCCFVRPG